MLRKCWWQRAQFHCARISRPLKWCCFMQQGWHDLTCFSLFRIISVQWLNMFKGRTTVRLKNGERRLLTASLVEWRDDNIHEKEEKVSRSIKRPFHYYRHYQECGNFAVTRLSGVCLVIGVFLIGPVIFYGREIAQSREF